MAPSSRSKRPLMSATGVQLVAGELRAVPFKVPEAIKAPPRKFFGETTSLHYQKQLAQVGDGTAKALIPYEPYAPRNRPKSAIVNEPGRRFHMPSCIKSERYRGSSSFTLSDSDPLSKRPWKTTSQVFSKTAQARNLIGLMNPGISADVATRVHKKQGIYHD